MRKVLLLTFGILACLKLTAKQITEQEALQKAQQFMQGKILTTPQKSRSMKRAATAHQSLYVFNVEDDGGFVIVSGDDRTDAILGYAMSGSIDETAMPQGLKAWMEQTAKSIEALAQQPAAQAPAPVASRTVAIHAEVKPLILTTWNQGNYSNDANTDGVYNVHLPMIYSRYPCTGCVATAGAQLMYYYRWPQDMTETVPGYKASSIANTSEDLQPIQFQWNQMKTRYDLNDTNAEAVSAVADLMLYAGYAAQMNYGVGSSGASTTTLAEGMTTYFDYNPDTWRSVSRYDYSISEWDELMYKELAHGRPVIYSGSSLSGGHAFLCDGYDGAGLYHFNWGWGGKGNGYFRLYEPSEYIFDNYCIIGLQPNSWPVDEEPDPSADDSWYEPRIEGLVATASNAKVDGTLIDMRLGNNNDETCGFGFGMAELKANGELDVLDTRHDIYQNWPLNKGYYYTSIKFDIAGYPLSEGKHTLVPVSLLSGSTEWKRCRPANFYFEVTVKDGQKTIVVHPREALKINKLELVSGSMPEKRQSIVMNVTNEGDNIEKTFYVFDGTEEAKGNHLRSQTIKIAAGNTKELRFSIGKLSEGEHVLWVASDFDATQVYAKLKVNIGTDLQVASIDVVGKKHCYKEIRVDAVVENHSGDYTEPLYLFASTSSSKNYAYAAGTAIEQGSSQVVSFYFKPSVAGTWNLWIATDDQGKNVIGQTTVDIAEANAANLTISEQALNFDGVSIKDEKITVRATVTNRSEYDYDDLIEVRFYELIPGTGRGSQVYVKQQEVTVAPSATVTVDFDFPDAVDGKSYFWYAYYYSMGSVVQSAGGKVHLFEHKDDVGIATLMAEPASTTIYDLLGRKMPADQHSLRPGLYIVNGRKVIVK